MVIKLVAVDRKWLEGGTPPLQKPVQQQKVGLLRRPEEGAATPKVRDAPSLRKARL